MAVTNEEDRWAAYRDMTYAPESSFQKYGRRVLAGIFIAATIGTPVYMTVIKPVLQKQAQTQPIKSLDDLQKPETYQEPSGLGVLAKDQ